MNKLFASLVALCVAFTGMAQLNNAFHETLYTDDGTLAGYPAGHSTYRIYVSLADGVDILTAVYATGNDIIILGAQDGNFWNSGFGAETGEGLGSGFFGLFPEVEYDSMVTIGRASDADPGQATAIATIAPSSTVLNEAMGVSVPGTDEFDSTVTITDGSWFTFPGDVNSVGSGVDNRILVAQITAAAEPEYQLNCQVLDGGIGGAQLLYVAYNGAGDAGDIEEASLAFPSAVATGCTDPLGCDYDPAATFDTGCDFSCYGCTDATACNYDATSTLDDGSCDFSCYGCMNEGACNYDFGATLDDGSCFFVGDPCDDGDANTTGDTVQDDCGCSGIAPLTLSPYGSCASVPGSVGGSAAIYTLVPASPGLHLEVITSDFDAQIDLDGPGFATDYSVNDNNGVGSEIGNFVNLQKGETYTITISSNSGTGNFSICATDLPETKFDYAPGNYELCDMIKADWVSGAENYRFRFQDFLGTPAGEWETGSAYTFAQLRNIMGLNAGVIYFVRCDAQYTVSTFDGGTEQVWVLGDVPTQITIVVPDNVVVRQSDNCANHGPHYLGDYIAAAPYQCGVTDWEWTFTNQAGGLPITHMRGNSNRYLRLSSVAGLEPGASYDVTATGVYPNGITTVTSPAECISIIGAAPGIAAGGPTVDADTEVLRTDVDAASAAIYPNPVLGDVVNVNLTGVVDTKVNMDIFDTFGKLVASRQLNVAEGNVNQVIAVGDLAAGVYTVNFTVNTQVITERLVVQK